MKKKYYLVIGIAFIVLISYLVWMWNSFGQFMDSGAMNGTTPEEACPSGQIRGMECGEVGGDKYTCYKPMSDAGKKCQSSSDCKGACVTDMINDCKQTYEDFGSLKLIAICDYNISGKCSQAKPFDVANNLLYNYSDVEAYIGKDAFDKLKTNYSITINNKIIANLQLYCA